MQDHIPRELRAFERNHRLNLIDKMANSIHHLLESCDRTLIFTFIWNDYFWAIVLTQGPDAQPVTALPPVAIFFLMQKHFIAGLTLGAVK